jgi:hypothetical protein
MVIFVLDFPVVAEHIVGESVAAEESPPGKLVTLIIASSAAPSLQDAARTDIVYALERIDLSSPFFLFIAGKIVLPHTRHVASGVWLTSTLR